MSINQLLPFLDDHPNRDDLQAYIDQVLEQPAKKIMGRQLIIFFNKLNSKEDSNETW